MAISPNHLLELASSRMISALSAYHIWKWLSQAININHLGGPKIVDRNLEIVNKYCFQQIMISSYKSFVVDLFVFFDSNKYQAFSLSKLMQSLRAQVSDTEYVGLKKEIDDIKNRHGITIGLIEELRNADVAHQEINSRSRLLSFSNIESLFAGVQEILNLISLKHDRSTTLWDHIPREIDGEMTWMFENLERGERARLQEIDQKDS